MMAENRNDGGSAFPATMPYSDAGMSIRDYFAGQALAGIMADYNIGDSFHDVAETSYALADAMLEARKHQAPAVVPSDPAKADSQQ